MLASPREVAELLSELKADVQSIKEAIVHVPDWISIPDIAQHTGLTQRAVRGQLHSGAFEEGVDYKRFGGTIKVSKAAVSRIKRKRRHGKTG